MPFLRFTRDKRGYENTYVLQSARRGEGTSAPRLLYWFRTPPHVKVGRLPLDEDAIRAIEEANPDIEFDWPKMLKLQVKSPPPPPEGRRERVAVQSKSSAGRQADRRATRTNRGARSAGQPVARPAPDMEADDILSASGESQPGVIVPGPIDAPQIESLELASLPEFGMGTDVEVDDVESASATHPVEAVLGAEGLSRLRALYAELQARISETLPDPVAREMLRVQVEGLNPDTWATEAEARERLETFEQQSDAVRSRLGRRRRRSRRGGRKRRKGPVPQPGDPTPDLSGEAPDGEMAGPEGADAVEPPDGEEEKS